MKNNLIRLEFKLKNRNFDKKVKKKIVTMKGKVIALLALMAICVNKCNSSAIPMWEYLSKEEKVRVR